MADKLYQRKRRLIRRQAIINIRALSNKYKAGILPKSVAKEISDDAPKSPPGINLWGNAIALRAIAERMEPTIICRMFQRIDYEKSL